MIYKKILLPIDGSKNSKRAAVHAINMADVSEGDVTILFVVEPFTPKYSILPIATLPSPDDDYFEEVRNEGIQIIKDFKKDLEENQCKDKCKNVHLKTLVKEGKAYIEILKTIDEEQFDLVVMGSSGRHSTLDRITLGSVTERVIRESRIPVLIIP
jgi:nucleotide-binding universal stress UspA family protein